MILQQVLPGPLQLIRQFYLVNLSLFAGWPNCVVCEPLHCPTSSSSLPFPSMSRGPPTMSGRCSSFCSSPVDHSSLASPWPGVSSRPIPCRHPLPMSVRSLNLSSRLPSGLEVFLRCRTGGSLYFPLYFKWFSELRVALVCRRLASSQNHGRRLSQVSFRDSIH